MAPFRRNDYLIARLMLHSTLEFDRSLNCHHWSLYGRLGIASKAIYAIY
jgi:hypothetical protein